MAFSKGKAIWHSQFVQDVADELPLIFDQLSADHGIYILYSSGTTGYVISFSAPFSLHAMVRREPLACFEVFYFSDLDASTFNFGQELWSCLGACF